VNQLESAQSEQIIIIIYYVNHTKVHDKNNFKKNKKEEKKHTKKTKNTSHSAYIVHNRLYI